MLVRLVATVGPLQGLRLVARLAIVRAAVFDMTIP